MKGTESQNIKPRFVLLQLRGEPATIAGLARATLGDRNLVDGGN